MELYLRYYQGEFKEIWKANEKGDVEESGTQRISALTKSFPRKPMSAKSTSFARLIFFLHVANAFIFEEG